MREERGRRTAAWTAALLAGAALLAPRGATPALEARPAALAPAETARGGTEPETWEGRFALDLRLATVARVPLVGAQRSVTRSLLLVEARRTGQGWTQRQRVCDVRISGGSARMDVPDAFVRSIHVRELASRFPAADGARYRADLGEERFGFDPALTGGAVPRHGRAPGVVDSDRDGSPGVTVVGRFPLFGRVRIFFAQRSHLVLDGRRTAPGRIDGRLDVLALEQRTLGASNRLFGRNIRVDPDEERSGFTLVAVPQVRNCEELKGVAPGLFGGAFGAAED